MYTHAEMIVCEDVEEIICPGCGAVQSLPEESKWQDDGTFQTCKECDCEFFCTREITPIYYSTEFKEE